MMKLTPEIADRIIAFIKGGASVSSAAAASSISTETFDEWLTSDDAFAKRIELASAEARLLAEIDLRRKAPGSWLDRRPKAIRPPQSAKSKAKAWDRTKRDKLTMRQAKFVREYIVDSNGTQAAIRAGYSRKGADVTGSRLLGNPSISAAIESKRRKLLARTDITVERVLRELACIAFVDPAKFHDADGNLLSIRDMPEDARRAIAGFEADGDGCRIRIAPKTPALEALAKHLGLFKTVDLNLHDDSARRELEESREQQLELLRNMTSEERRTLLELLRTARARAQKSETGVTPAPTEARTRVGRFLDVSGLQPSIEAPTPEASRSTLAETQETTRNEDEADRTSGDDRGYSPLASEGVPTIR